MLFILISQYWPQYCLFIALLFNFVCVVVVRGAELALVTT